MIRLGDEPVTVQLPDPTGRPLQAPDADPGLAPPWSGASDDAPSLVIDVRGAWDPDADRSLEVTRTAQDPSWPEVEVVQVDLGCASPAVVTLFAAELERLRGELDQAGSERVRLREQVQRLNDQRQADALQQRQLHEEIEASRETRKRLDADRQAALDEVDRYQVAVDKLSRSLCDAQSRHDSASNDLAREYADARDRWDRERREEAARREEQRAEHARQMAAVVRGDEEQLAAVMAELEQSQQAFETARRCHESRQAGLARELAAATKQGEDRLAALREQFERERTALLGQVDEHRSRCEIGQREFDLTTTQLDSALRQRDHLTVTGAALRQQVHALESALDAARAEAETARDEARHEHEGLIHLRHTLELAAKREQAATAENHRLTAAGAALQQQIRALESIVDAAREEVETCREETRRGHEELIHLRHTLELAERREQAVAAENHGLSATGAELQDQLLAFETALSAAREEAETAQDEARRGHEELIHLRHTLELAERREQAAVAENHGSLATAAELRQQLSALETELSASREEAEMARDEARRGQEALVHLRHTLDLAERREHAEAAENSGLSATSAELQEQLAALETALSASREEAETARNEARREHQDLLQIRPELERAQRIQQAASAENRVLAEQIRAREIDAERERQLVETERLESHQRLADLQAELESRQTHWQAVLDETRRQFLEEIRALRQENETGRNEAELVRRERDLERCELQGLVQNQELLAQTLAMVEAAQEMAQEQSRAEIARRDAALAEAVRRSESSVTRTEELNQELAELRAELDRLQMEASDSPVNGRVHAVAAAAGTRPRLEADWTKHCGSESYRGTRSTFLPQSQDSRELSLRAPMHSGETSLQSACLAEESPTVEFPNNVDLGLVRALVEMLNGLLSKEQSSGHILIYQQRLIEFSQKIREASRLATNLANEVEQSRQRDKMQFHMYLVRRAEEIDKPPRA